MMTGAMSSTKNQTITQIGNSQLSSFMEFANIVSSRFRADIKDLNIHRIDIDNENIIIFTMILFFTCIHFE